MKPDDYLWGWFDSAYIGALHGFRSRKTVNGLRMVLALKHLSDTQFDMPGMAACRGGEYCTPKVFKTGKFQRVIWRRKGGR